MAVIDPADSGRTGRARPTRKCPTDAPARGRQTSSTHSTSRPAISRSAADDYSAVMRLRERTPGAEIWLERVGQRTAYQMRIRR